MPEFKTVRGVIKNLNQVAGIVVVKLSLDITSNLIEATPVLTGWSRANWVPVIGAPVFRGSGTSKATGNMLSSASGEQSSSQAALVASGYKITQGKISISNGVPYIELLNSGSSKKAPRGFVQRAIEKGITTDIKVPNL